MQVLLKSLCSLHTAVIKAKKKKKLKKNPKMNIHFKWIISLRTFHWNCQADNKICNEIHCIKRQKCNTEWSQTFRPYCVSTCVSNLSIYYRFVCLRHLKHTQLHVWQVNPEHHCWYFMMSDLQCSCKRTQRVLAAGVQLTDSFSGFSWE